MAFVFFDRGKGLGDDEQEKRKNSRRVGLYTGIPSMFIGGLLFGYYAGKYLDKRYHTEGIWTGVCVLLGLAASMYSIFKMIMTESKGD